jgi:hypothetical protein
MPPVGVKIGAPTVPVIVTCSDAMALSAHVLSYPIALTV